MIGLLSDAGSNLTRLLSLSLTTTNFSVHLTTVRVSDSSSPRQCARCKSEHYYYSAPVGERSIAISLSVCLCVCLCVCLPVREHISGTAGPIFTKFCVRIPCYRGSVFLWRRCDKLCTTGYMDDVTFRRSGPYGDA